MGLQLLASITHILKILRLIKSTIEHADGRLKKNERPVNARMKKRRWHLAKTAKKIANVAHTR